MAHSEHPEKDDRSTPPPSRPRLRAEIAIVLGLSLGASAVYSIVSIANKLTLETPLAQQSTSLNTSQSARPVFDLIYQLLSIVFDLVPVALVVFLLWQAGRHPMHRLGFDLTRPARDTGGGIVLFLAIGIPGIVLYVVGRLAGITVAVSASPLDTFWWTVPVLVLSALRAALTEELIVVCYLFARLGDLGWGRWKILVGTALLRGTYHLYQGIGPFIGNVVMGLVFGWLYQRFGRILPLVVAHLLLDIASFVGYPLAVGLWPELFGVPAGD